VSELVKVEQGGTLEDLAVRINAEHRACEAALKSGLAHAAKAGVLLIEAKSHTKHGEWERWLAENFEGSVRTAQAYMRVAGKLSNLEGANAQRVAHLSLRSALKELAESSQEGRRGARSSREANRPERLVVSHTYNFEKRPDGLPDTDLPLLCRPTSAYADENHGMDWSAADELWSLEDAIDLDGDGYGGYPPPLRPLSWSGYWLNLPTGCWHADLWRGVPFVWWRWDRMEAEEIAAAADPDEYHINWLETKQVMEELIGPYYLDPRDSAKLEAALAADLEAVRAHRQAKLRDLTAPRTVYEIGERVLPESKKRLLPWKRFAAFVESGGDQWTR